jgi:hypothetical protein
VCDPAASPLEAGSSTCSPTRKELETNPGSPERLPEFTPELKGLKGEKLRAVPGKTA